MMYLCLEIIIAQGFMTSQGKEEEARYLGTLETAVSSAKVAVGMAHGPSPTIPTPQYYV